MGPVQGLVPSKRMFMFERHQSSIDISASLDIVDHMVADLVPFLVWRPILPFLYI